MTDDTSPRSGPGGAVDRFFAWFFALRPVRVALHSGSLNGPLLSAGLAYQALFALFAALWSGFAVAGIALSNSPTLRDSLFSVINTSIPGLLKTSSGSGAIDTTQLLHAGIFGVTGLVSLAVLVFTAVGFLGSARGAVRQIFAVAPPTTNFYLLKAKDLGLGLLFGLAVLLSSALSLISTSSVRFLLDVLRISETTLAASVLLRLVGLLVVFAFDTAVLIGLFKVLAGLRIPRRRLVSGSLLGAFALGVLKAAGGLLLGRGTNNPLLASFAVIVGLLIFLNLVCQVLILTASWIAVRMLDDGILADPVAERERLVAQAEERLRREAERHAEIVRRAHRAEPPLTRLAIRVRKRLSRADRE
jgi:membrane protein